MFVVHLKEPILYLKIMKNLDYPCKNCVVRRVKLGLQTGVKIVNNIQMKIGTGSNRKNLI